LLRSNRNRFEAASLICANGAGIPCIGFGTFGMRGAKLKGLLIHAIRAGFRHIDAVSFVSPKAVPQMADSEAVLAQLAPPNDVEIIGIVVNEKGAERAIATGAVRTLGFPYSISPTFLRRNQKQSPEENLVVLKRVVERSKQAELGTVAYISMAFGNPYGDAWSVERVAEAAQMLQAPGVDAISLADTVGTADPDLVGAVVSRLRVTCELGVHAQHAQMRLRRCRNLRRRLPAVRRSARRMGGCRSRRGLCREYPDGGVCRALEKRGIQLSIRQSPAALKRTVDWQTFWR
jgi:hydroxymethylglutaryl-CoA lyase